MTRKFKPVSRLSIFFIVAIVISGSILTYFSINNISNLKELTEKRILEEQRELSARFSVAIQHKIGSVKSGFTNEIRPPELMIDSLINTVTDHDFVTLPFKLTTEGLFLYPNFDRSETLFKPKSSTRFNAVFRQGEKSEFAKNDLISAHNNYLSCLNYATFDYDSVKALNALGRVSVKLNEYENAVGHYELIILNHCQVSTAEGVPYVYFALPQLFKISNSDNREKILSLVELSLKKMEVGSIPLNFGTKELLTLVTKWIQETTFENPKRVEHISELEKNINQQLQFVNEYSNEISELIKEGNLDNHLIIGNDFKVVNSFSGNNQELLLVNTNFKNPSGFLIDGKKLFDTILKMEIQSGLEFDYKIEFPTGYNSNTTGQNLVYSSQLNPYFPGQLIKIELNDKNLISDFVRRRSWIYGIATALLLVAMSLGVVLILRDVSREKHLMRLRSDFISNVTHELKTPLTSIYMFAESLLLGRVKSNTGREEYLSIILKESKRLKRMINNILEFSKMEKRKPEYHFVHSNLAAILTSAIHDMNYWFEKGNFEVFTELDEKISTEIEPEKMKQAFGNLLSNAYKYSVKTKKILIRLFKKENNIIVEFEDQGMGISEDQLPRIFEKFYRVDQKESISGTGLGLTVVKEIIEAHNGKIGVTSKLGKGSKFTIVLKQQIQEV